VFFMAAITAAVRVLVMSVPVLLRRLPADDRAAATRPQWARQQPVAKRHDAALKHPCRPIIRDARTEVESNPYAQVVEHSRELAPGARIRAHDRDNFQEIHGFLDLLLDVTPASCGTVGARLIQLPLRISQLGRKITGRRPQLCTHRFVLFFEDTPGSLFDLPPEPLHLGLEFLTDSDGVGQRKAGPNQVCKMGELRRSPREIVMRRLRSPAHPAVLRGR
jgi:hypothetical protein